MATESHISSSQSDTSQDVSKDHTNVSEGHLEISDPLARQPSLGDSIIGPNALISNDRIDSDVSFEEYSYFADLTRRYEQSLPVVHSFTILGKTIWKREPQTSESQTPEESLDSHRVSEKDFSNAERQEPGKDSLVTSGKNQQNHDQRYLEISDDERHNASRAFRTASWSAIFYLLIMDILGPFSVPWAFAALGYGPGVAIYTILCLFATYNGYLLWKMFLGMDSDKYPVKTYADIAFRIYGNTARHVVTILQSTQLMFNVGIIILINGLSLDQIITGSGRNAVCFIVLCLIWALAGMIFGQIKTLRRLAWVANFAIWLNVFSIIAIMGVVASSGVLQDAAAKANAAFNIFPGEPISTSAGGRGLEFTVSVTGVMSAVYSFGGAILFVEFLSEMSRPMDFWKALICAEVFIYVLYLMFGLFVYSFQGQYTFNPTYQGLAPYKWRAAINSMQLVTSCVATLLYANIGLKVVYNNVLISLFNVPPLTTKTGKFLWAVFVPFYWSLAFIIATAIPQVSNLGGLIAAACVLQFSFTFPPVLLIGFNIHRDSMVEGDGWDPLTRTLTRQDKGWTRLWRGFRKRMLWNLVNTVLFLASAGLAVLGIYSAIVQIRSFYSRGASTAFSCKSPYSQ